MVRSAKDWAWSSYRATAGQVEAHSLLTTDWILGNFGRKKTTAQKKYRTFVQQGKMQSSPWDSLKNQINLGPHRFVQEMQCLMDPGRSLSDITKPQKSNPVKPLIIYKGKV